MVLMLKLFLSFVREAQKSLLIPLVIDSNKYHQGKWLIVFVSFFVEQVGQQLIKKHLYLFLQINV